MKKQIRIFLVLSLTIGIIISVFVLMNNTFTQTALHENLQQEGQHLRNSFDSLLAKNYNNMLAMATFISHDSEVQSLFLAGKKAVEAEGGGAGGPIAATVRKDLLDKVGPSWLEVQKDFQLRQLHFHLGPGSTSFLRVHRPDKFGDNMDDVRFTVVDTNAKQSSHTGFETGRVYSGLRAVIPVSAWDSDEGKTVHVGVLEVGTSFDAILKIIDKRYDLGSGILLTMDHVTSAMWPDFVKQRFNNGMDQCDCVIEASSRDGIVDIVHQVQGDGVHARKIGTEIVRVEDTFYAVSHFPLRDYLGDKDPTRDAVGAILFWRNADAQMAAFNRSQLFNIIYGVLGFLFIEALLFFSFRYAIHKLEKEVAQRTMELSESETRLSNAQRIAHLGNWDWNIVDNELWWSDEIYRIFELSPNTFKATYDTFIETIHSDDRELVIQAIESALQDNKPYNIEYRITLPDGSEKTVHEQAELIFGKNGTPVRMMGTILDITERKKVEQERDENRNQLSLALEGANLGLWDWSPFKDVLHTNEIFLTMLGYSPNDFPETTERWSSLVHPDDLALSVETLQPYIDGDDGFYRAEFRMRSADNHWKSILDVGQVMSRNADGKADRFMGVHIDITDRVHAEEALKKSKQKLETMVSELSASKINIERQASELAALAKKEAVLNNQLKYEVEIKDKFFSIIAHDLRSPFNILLGMTNIMVDMSDSNSKEELVEYAMHTNIAAKQVFELLRNLLDWSLVQMEGKTPEQKIVPLRDLAQKSIEVLKPVALQKEIALINEIQETTAFSDPNMVETVIRNLVANALKFTPSGGLVKVSSLQHGDKVQVMVTDTGVGMSEEQMENIFALDQKSSTSGTAGEAGTGLGLPLCKEMVEKNGGRIWIVSAPGEGSTVTFTMRASE